LQLVRYNLHDTYALLGNMPARYAGLILIKYLFHYGQS
jgi:hypothetical protein